MSESEEKNEIVSTLYRLSIVLIVLSINERKSEWERERLFMYIVTKETKKMQERDKERDKCISHENH